MSVYIDTRSFKIKEEEKGFMVAPLAREGLGKPWTRNFYNNLLHQGNSAATAVQMIRIEMSDRHRFGKEILSWVGIMIILLGKGWPGSFLPNEFGALAGCWRWENAFPIEYIYWSRT